MYAIRSYYDRYDVYIAAGMYKDKLKEKILEIFYKDLVINRFGEKDYGYFWVNRNNFV